jgi:hypothetical protein
LTASNRSQAHWPRASITLHVGSYMDQFRQYCSTPHSQPENVFRFFHKNACSTTVGFVCPAVQHPYLNHVKQYYDLARLENTRRQFIYYMTQALFLHAVCVPSAKAAVFVPEPQWKNKLATMAKELENTDLAFKEADNFTTGINGSNRMTMDPASLDQPRPLALMLLLRVHCTRN